MTRKFSESEIGRAEVAAIEKAQKTIKSSKPGMPSTYLEGVRVQYRQGEPSARSSSGRTLTRSKTWVGQTAFFARS